MEITIEDLGSGGALVALRGDVDALTADELLRALQKLLNSGRHRLALDFTNVVYISSAGTGTILRIQQETTKLGGMLRLFGLSKSVRRVFTILGFDRIITIVGDRDGALKGWQDTGDSCPESGL